MEENIINENKIRQALGEILCYEKYKFLPNGLVGEVTRDFCDALEKFTKEDEN